MKWFKVQKQFKFIDLTHALESVIPTWNGSCGFESSIKSDYAQGCRVQALKMHAGIGTHIDAPSHFFADGHHIADIPIEQLFVPVSIIDVRHKIHPDYEVSVKDIQDYEKDHGVIIEDSLVFAETGWSQYWEDIARYRNEDRNGHMHFPGFSSEAAEFLIGRKIVGIGIDTLSPDGSNMNFPVHQAILGEGKYIIENLTNLDKMPKKGAFVVALPIKINEGTEAAARVIGMMQAGV